MRGWILAGGASTRFGSDKAVWPMDGVPLSVRIAGVLSAAGLEPWLVARAPRGLGLPELLEPPGDLHPLRGVAHALAASAAAGDALALVCPCDLVDLSVEQVALLVASAPAVARGQPLFGVFPVELAARAAVLAEAGMPARALVEELPVVELGALGNLNRPPKRPSEGRP